MISQDEANDQPERRDFFISYTGADRQWAKWIAWNLEEAGYTISLQAWDFQPGSNFVIEMDRAAMSAERTLLVLSPAYLESDYAFAEWATVFRSDPQRAHRLLLPVRIQPCEVEGLLGSMIYIDLVSLDEAQARKRLLAGVQQGRAKPIAMPFPRYSIPNIVFPGSIPAIYNIPYPRNPFFTGHKQLLDQLANALRVGKTAALSQTQVQAISGLGGIGKTQIAIEYAYQHSQDYQAILWTSADTAEALIAGYGEIAHLLRLPEQDEPDQSVVIKAVQNWLKIQTGWLLILDGADDLALVRELLPSTFNGHILLTTRNQLVGKMAVQVKMDTMDSEVGTLLLLRRAGLISSDASLETALPSDIALARSITEDLGGLPLAINQAGAYVEETGCGLANYQHLYQTQRAKLLQNRGGVIDDHPDSVATTWLLAFKQVEQRNPAAADLLQLCAFLAPDAIPEELLTRGAEKMENILATVASNPYQLDQTIIALRAYSLISRDAQAQTITVHRLVQAVLRDSMSSEAQLQWMQIAVHIVNAAFPDIEFANWPICERLLPHALTCAIWIEQASLITPEASHLLTQAGYYLNERGRYGEAEPLYQRALAIYEQQLGANHPNTAQSLNNLAGLYENQGKYAEAEPLYQRALAIYEQQLGASHPNTAQSLNNLAGLYVSQGKYVEAESLLQRSLAIREQQLGANHPDTAQSLNNLAGLYVSQGKYIEAEPLLQRAMAIREQQLGVSHPVIAQSLDNLANLYMSQEKYTETKSLYQRSLAIREQQLGTMHPDTAQSLNNLANLYQKQGKYTQAEPIFQRALYILTQVFGPDNPNVVYSRNNLASIYIKHIDIDVIKGNGMLVDRENELVLRITNRTDKLLERLDIELQPSAEYHIVPPNSVSITELKASSSQEAYFRLQVHKPKQVTVNYKINGEMQKEALYVYAIKDNPYVYGNPVHEETAFFGRKAEREEIIQAVTKPIKQDILIVGERRTGKTSLLYQLKKHLDLPYVAVYIVLTRSKPTTEDILALIRRSIISQLVDLKLLDNSWKMHCFLYEDFEDNVKDILNAARVRLDDIKIVLLLDEADYLLQVVKNSFSETLRGFFRKTPQVDERLQNILRAALQSEVGARLRAVLASTNDLPNYISKHSSPLFNQFRFLPLRPLSHFETEDLIRTPLTMLGYTYTSDVVQRIKSLSGGHPYYCQALCYEAFGKILQSKHNTIGDLEMDYAEKKIMNDLCNAYLSGFWERASKIERKHLMQLAHGHSLSDAPTIQLQRLLDWQIITRVKGNVEFSAELFKKWTLQAL